jgi:hypothetical protein
MTMVPISALLLPILLSAVIVFVASSIIHMFLPYHRSDYGRIPEEESVMGELRRAAVAPGDYMLPYAATPKDMSDPAYLQRREQGPVALITIADPGRLSMGPMLAIWFIYILFVSVLVAYLTGRTHSPGAEYLSVFRIAGTTAFAAYVLALWPQSIWFHRPWSTTLKSSFDGVVYALLTAGAFGALWP